jgi:hypothetical protein
VASRANPNPGSFQILTRAQRTRINFCPQQWLLCHLGLYWFELECEFELVALHQTQPRIDAGDASFTSPHFAHAAPFHVPFACDTMRAPSSARSHSFCIHMALYLLEFEFEISSHQKNNCHSELAISL